ncbi:hypothetical protein [Actinomadura rupiterrae]|uniref:hypothetical protein n=1 Tax=Actinomadura rupiterrae TaxID=559627 RepID=UPI0020A3929C|nr:hypothetical protein [Actinomadura rupiterrae]MCP2335236.1 type II secretory pathway predicted ATPase ExeA [Actinomadura rupiterrae]
MAMLPQPPAGLHPSQAVTASRGPRLINNLAFQALRATLIADKTSVDETAARSSLHEVIATE